MNNTQGTVRVQLKLTGDELNHSIVCNVSQCGWLAQMGKGSHHPSGSRSRRFDNMKLLLSVASTNLFFRA